MKAEMAHEIIGVAGGARKLKNAFKLIAPLAISLTLHSGPVFGPSVYPKIEEALRSKISLSETAEKNAEAEKNPLKKDLFAKERKEYVSELFSGLKQGKDIRLSEFFIKSELLDPFMAPSEGSIDASISKYTQKYESLVAQAKEHVKGSNFPLKSLHDFMHNHFSNGYDPNYGTILELLDTGWGNCNASTQLFSSLMEDVLGIHNQQFLKFNDHIASVVKNARIENTDPSWKSSYAGFDGCGARLPKEVMVAAYLLANGVPKEELPQRVQKFYDKKWFWPARCQLAPGKNEAEPSGTQKVYPYVGIESGMDVPNKRIPNKKNIEELVAVAKVIRYAYEVYYGEKSNPGIGEVPVIAYAMRDIDLGRLLRIVKEFDFESNLMGYYPKERRCDSKPQSVLDSQILELAQALPENRGIDLKAKLCSEYTEFAKKAKAKEILLDFPFSFCEKEIRAIRQRYASGELLPSLNDDKIVMSHIKGMAFTEPEQYLIARLSYSLSKEDFQFFIGIFQNAKSDMVRKYALYSALFSDPARGCPFLLMQPSSPVTLNPKIIVCRNKQAIWESARDLSNPESRGLSFMRGPYLSEEEIDELISISVERRKTGQLTALMKISRILAEHADYLPESSRSRKEELYRRSDDIVKFVVENTMKEDSSLDTAFAEFSPRHAEMMIPAFKGYGDHLYIATKLACALKPGDLAKMKKESREAMSDEFGYLRLELEGDHDNLRRIYAAIVMMDLGVDPLAEE